MAVLPFVNASADPSTEYLSDGISESIINSLSQLPKLRVMARTTVFRYKGKDQLSTLHFRLPTLNSQREAQNDGTASAWAA